MEISYDQTIWSLCGPEWAAVAAEKGADVDVIANVVNGAAVWIAAAPDVKFDSVKDLKSGTVVSPGQMPTTSTSLFFKLLKENGMSPSDISLMQVPLGSEIGPLVAGQSKVAVMYEPGLDQAVAKGMKVVLSFPKLYRRICDFRRLPQNAMSTLIPLRAL